MRLLVFGIDGSFEFEIPESSVAEAVRVEEVNGEHSLRVRTSAELSQGQRIVHQDGTGRWYEHVVTGADEVHDSSGSTSRTYYATWSLQHDLSTVYADDVEVGGETPAPASTAMTYALDGQSRWSLVAPSGISGTATIEMFGNSAWERICQVVAAYGGEIEDRLTVGSNSVTSRAVALVGAVGSNIVTRRFEWGRDLASIRRKPQEGPLACRIIPVGASEDVTIYDLNTSYQHYNASGGFTTDQVNFLEDREAALAYRTPNGQGGWQYPTIKVRFDIDDDRELLSKATEHITDYTRPTPTYEAGVMQYADAGMDVRGVSLGDVVHIVDRYFGEPLRLEARVTRIETDLLDLANTRLTVGQIGDSLSMTWRNLDALIGGVKSRLDAIYKASGGTIATSQYLGWLLDKLNAEINANGGFTYILNDSGGGIRTYNKVVADPETGLDADEVVEIKGGSIRIADSKENGDWKWRTVFVSGHILADLVTAAKIVSGFIGSAGDTFIDLDNHTVQLGPSNGNHLIVDSGGIDLYAGSTLIAHLGKSTYTVSGATHTGTYYSFGTRASSTQGVNSFSSGDGNYLGTNSEYCSALGRGLYGTNYEGGAVIGKYNKMSGNLASPEILTSSFLEFVIGNGTSSARSNALEVDANGNLGIKGQLVSPCTGTVVEATGTASARGGTLPTKVVGITLPTKTGGGKDEVWVVSAYIKQTQSYSTSNPQGLLFATISTSDTSMGNLARESGIMPEANLTCIYKPGSHSNVRTLYIVAYGGDNSITSVGYSGTIRAVRIV